MKENTFLRCLPSVFVIEGDYEILINTKENGIIAVECAGEVFYEENSGALSSEKSYAKIRVPQRVLDGAGEYTVLYRKTLVRRAYFSELGDWMRESFAFRTLKKTDNINIYHIADVHYHFEMAKQTASFFGDALDLLVVNGDIGEVESEENYFEVCRLVGEISRGALPVVFTRGNHDTRGKLAERFTDFFPSCGKNTYYTFRVGPLSGIVLDCGEDKPDTNAEYGGVNAFHAFRKRETAFLQGLSPSSSLTFLVSHISPAQNTLHEESQFNIEDATYRQWCAELERLGVRFSLSGHTHKAYVLEKNSKESLRPHSFPVIVGSACFRDSDLWGAALTLSGSRLTVRFTDISCKVREEYTLDLSTGRLAECANEAQEG